MSTDELFNFADKQNYHIHYDCIPYSRSMTIKRGEYHILLDKHLSGAEEKELTAHEIGHCESGCLYSNIVSSNEIERAEYRANKWAYRNLLPLDDIKIAMAHGIVTLWDLAEYFEVSCEFMEKAVCYYRAKGTKE